MTAARILVVSGDVRRRRALSAAVDADTRFRAVGVAPSGRIAVAKLAQLAPEGVLLDASLLDERLEEVVGSIKGERGDLPVVVVCETESCDTVRLEAAARAGAEVVFARPGRDEPIGRALEIFARIYRLRDRDMAAPANPGSPMPDAAAASPSSTRSTPTVRRIDVVAIGASTGGPRALETVLTALCADFPVPVLITQHMPPVFTKNLGVQLDRASHLRVKEAEEGESLEPGMVYIAPGDFHLELRRRTARFELALHQGPPENSCRPAVDVMLRSVLGTFAASTLTVILTGMGQDGLRGCEQAASLGAPVYVQDEATSVVWGMPGFVAKAGLADKVLALEAMGPEIERRVWVGRQRPWAARQRRESKAV